MFCAFCSGHADGMWMLLACLAGASGSRALHLQCRKVHMAGRLVTYFLNSIHDGLSLSINLVEGCAGRANASSHRVTTRNIG